MSEYKRNCPKCGCEIVYSQKCSFNRANKHNRICKRCASDLRVNVSRSEETRTKISNAHKQKYTDGWISPNLGRHLSDETREKISQYQKGRPKSEEHKKRIGQSNLGRIGLRGSDSPRYGTHPSALTLKKMSDASKNRRRSKEWRNNHSKMMTGRKHTEQTKEKMRLNRIEELRLKGIVVGSKFSKNFNVQACEFIDTYGKSNGFNFQHALNGGERIISGYSVDGYDEHKNIIFEYDEPHHELNSVKQQDILRNLRLLSLGFKIIRYSKKFDKIYECYPEHSLIIL